MFRLNIFLIEFIAESVLEYDKKKEEEEEEEKRLAAN